MSTNDYEEAHEAIDFALAIDDSNAEALTLKAFCYQQSGELQKSCDYYLRLAEQQENKTRAYLALAKTYFEMQDYTSSIYYIEALLDNKDALSKYELSELYGDIALCHAAPEAHRRGTSIHPAFFGTERERPRYAYRCRTILPDGSQSMQ